MKCMDESSSCHVVSYDLRRREIQKKKKTRKANNESETKLKFKKKNTTNNWEAKQENEQAATIFLKNK